MILDGTRENVFYDKNIGVRLFLNRETENYPLHWHTAFEIIMPIENSYSVYVDKTKYELTPNDIIVLPSGELHELYAPVTGSRLILQFDCSMILNINGFDSAFHMFHPCVFISKDNMLAMQPQLKEILLQIMDEYFNDSPLKEAAIYYKLIEFFVILSRNYINDVTRFPKTTSNKQHEYIDKFLTVCNYINDHCTENIDVQDLANIAGFSKFHFMRLFKQFSNISYYSYLNIHRIMYAEKLLIDPSLTITDIAMQSGFNSLATFNRIFKAQKKCTPSEYKLLYNSHRNRH